MFLVIMGVMVVMVVVTIFLPQLSGLATYTNNPDYIKKQNEKKESKAKISNQFTTEQHDLYEAPDAYIDGDDIVKTSSRFTSVRSTINKITHPNLTERDIPIKLELFGESDLKRRARSNKENVGTNITNDPNNFDYDIDEFIDEENKKDEQEYLEAAEKKYGSANV
ncbi:hypothetical protein C6P40_002958 [Pichia californica]|uniref:Uncharacterized protein n=1 Tax=Pichia californica TaxID=460514 RepID=A0A9P6WH23_9ASCO|nr:hypothetical protein C6P42_002750 [[Candida] californica]KAG0687054.1 hypothetical protein C6P40_002958 [[Candida] californica]